MSKYLDKVSQGNQVLIRDDKRDMSVAQINPVQTFDPVAFQKALDKAAGVFSAENHPEWRTKKDVIKWLRETRKNFDRKF
ncbi:MAG: hypothetical protein AAB414_05150 [Patescibacteria group bacterium]